MKLDSKENLLSKNLKLFYNQGQNLENVIKIVNQKTTISLRLLDWLVTNYSKKHKVFYELSNEVIDGHIIASHSFDMYSDYKNQLKASNKKYFDPFSRSQRIFIFKDESGSVDYKLISKDDIDKYKMVSEDGDNDDNDNTTNTSEQSLVSTIGQLNFFKWAITYGIINYATKNRDLIEADMLNTVKERKKSKVSITTGTTPTIEKQKRTLSKTNHVSRSSSKKIIVQFV